VVSTLTNLNTNITGALELFEMAKEESDFETLGAIEVDTEGYSKTIADLEFRRMFHNEMDPCNCFIDIQAGAGGT
jgi:peptide chain release factor 2